MDELLARERAAHEYVKSLQSHQETPFKDILAAFEQYRTIVQETVFAKFSDAEKLETRLWQQHYETRQILARTLKELRKTQEEKVVEIRVAVEMYLRFIKHSVRFYRGYIFHMSTRFGGIPELQAVAAQVKQSKTDEIQAATGVDPMLRQQALQSCYRTLIYLGDLCRYPALDNLDSKQDFGPAIGFYGLACTICPEIGWGYHQQSLVAIEQKDYLRAVYHLYRAFLLPEPHALAKKHLSAQFSKANSAWEKGELIARGPPHDPAATEKALVGWFIRLHSMCVTGEVFRGYEELLHELLSRLSSVSRHRAFDAKLRRMTLINIGAQHTAMENYKALQTPQIEQAFYYSMHINILFFTTLLETFHEQLVALAKDPELVDAELELKVTPIMIQILPTLKLYGTWLVINMHLVLGLASEGFLASSIERFWIVYARNMDLISSIFPIWELEDCKPLTYLLSEDVETIEFAPMVDQQFTDPLKSGLYDVLGNLKPRYSDAKVQQLSAIEEALGRILTLLQVGSHIATIMDDTPLQLLGTRFYLDNAGIFEMPTPPTPPPVEKPKPLSYAAAAAKRQAQSNGPHGTGLAVASVPNGALNLESDNDQMQRMVDNLVDDDDTDQPITPPQQLLTHETVIKGTGDALMTGLSPLAKAEYGLTMPSTTVMAATALSQQQRSQPKRKEDLSDFSPRPKLIGDRVASLWSPGGNVPSRPNSKSTSPAQLGRALHQRQGSSNSARSTASPHLMESWSSVESAPRGKHFAKGSLTNGIAATGALQQGLSTPPVDRIMSSPHQSAGKPNASPLLFGAPSIWSATHNAQHQADFGG